MGKEEKKRKSQSLSDEGSTVSNVAVGSASSSGTASVPSSAGPNPQKTKVETPSNSMSTPTDLCLIDHEKMLLSFLDIIDNVEATPAKDSAEIVMKATTTLLQLKSQQREILGKVAAMETLKQEKFHQLQERKMMLASLQYEKQFLQNQLKSYEFYQMPQLEAMCRQELDDQDASATEVIERFLCQGKPLADSHELILQRLHKEINLRGNLERDTKLLLKKKKEMLANFETKKKFVKELPKKIDSIERASLGLQNFFPSKLAGTDRKKRLDLVKTLSGPIYNIFCQFQAHLDFHTSLDSSSSISLEISRKRDGHQSVSLSFLLPDLVGNKPTKKRVTIEFACAEKQPLIVAKAFGPSDRIHTFALLHNLFPGDDGSWWNSAEQLNGVPYHWCNYLAGFHFPSRQDRCGSTQSVMQRLADRVQCNSMLTQLLHLFEKKQQVLTHPTLEKKSPVTKLVNFVSASSQKKDDTSVIRKYVATLKSDGSKKSSKGKTMKAYIEIDLSQYPKVPPRWSFCQNGSDALYDSALGRLEEEVNSDPKKFVDNETKAWLVAHQLHHVLQHWDKEAGRGKVGRDRVSRNNE